MADSEFYFYFNFISSKYVREFFSHDFIGRQKMTDFILGRETRNVVLIPVDSLVVQ